MTAKKALIVLAVLGTFSGPIAANEKYHVVKICHEVPRGCHFYTPYGVAVDKAGNVSSPTEATTGSKSSIPEAGS